MVKQTEFRFNAGCLALDLPATIRRRASEPDDVLAAPGASARWLRDAGLSVSLLSLSETEQQALMALREAIWAASHAARRGLTLPGPEVDIINQAAAHHLAIPALDAATSSARFIADNPFRTALATIARDAITLLSTPSRLQIKACAQEDCQMLFLDSSRSSRRRWCSMDRCGSRAKGETFRHRHRDAPET